MEGLYNALVGLDALSGVACRLSRNHRVASIETM